MTLTAGAIARKTDVEAAILTTGTYTPVITSVTSNPVVGATGFLNGSYARMGRLIFVWVDLAISGAGASFGGLSWRITVPYLADLAFHTPNVLNAASHAIGTHETRSGTAAQSVSGAVLLAGPTGTDTTGTAMIFYHDGSNTSVGNTDFTTDARLKAHVQYVADASMTLV